MSEHADPAEFTSAFVSEVEDLLRAGTAGLLSIEGAMRTGGRSPARAVRELFRVVHTVKGLAAMVGVQPIVSIAHDMEASLWRADQAGGLLSPGAVDTLLQGLRAIEERVAAVAANRPVPEVPKELKDLLASLDALLESESGAPPVAPPAEPAAPPISAAAAAMSAAGLALGLDDSLIAKMAPFEIEQLTLGIAQGRRGRRVDFVPSRAHVEGGLSITTARERVGKIAEIVKVLPISLPVSAGAPAGIAFVMLVLTDASDMALALAAGTDATLVRMLRPSPGGAPAPAPSPGPSIGRPPPPPEAESPSILDDVDLEPRRRSVVRVEVSRLDDALERLGALTVTRYRLARALAALEARGVEVRELKQVLSDNARQLRDLRAAVIRVRMVPVSDVLERVPLVVRGLKRATGTAVHLELDAGRGELDKAVAERIFPAIVHLVRNAVDHAIESPAERRAAGKPEEGLLRITSSERSNTQLELRIEDDGRGIDRERIAARAGQPVPRTDAALLDLICTPGLTTREEVSTTSGRGMGMDIVRKIIIEQLGGELLLSTTPGAGTTVTLRVPLSIAIIEAFSLECATERFVVPVSMVDEIFEVEPAKVVPCPARQRAGVAGTAFGMIERRGKTLLLARLTSSLGMASADDASKGGPSRAGSSGNGHEKALVVRHAAEAIAFGVDRMLGQQEVVVRPLDDRLTRVPGILGATDLGDGRPTLVLDLVSLAARLASRVAEEAA